VLDASSSRFIPELCTLQTNRRFVVLDSLVGNIAQMIDLARKSNENSPVSGAVHDAFARSVKVVAGARNRGGRLCGGMSPGFASMSGSSSGAKGLTAAYSLTMSCW